MPINWNETLLGAHGAEAEPGYRDPAFVLGVLRVGQLAGVFASALLVAMALAAIPVANSPLLPFLFGSTGLLLAHVLGFVALDRFGRRAMMAPVLASMAGVVAAIPFGIAPVIGMAGLVATAALWQREALRGREEILLALAVASIGVAVLTIVIAGFQPLASALMIAVCAPVLVSAAQFRRAHRESETNRRGDEKMNRALVEAALSRLPPMRAIVDATGRIEALPRHAMFANQVAESAFGDASLVELALIADRPKLLKALSDAIHSGTVSTGLVVRLRQDRDDLVIAAPPNYQPVAIDVLPAPGLSGRAIVLAEAIVGRGFGTHTEDSPGAADLAIVDAAAESELLARAFHDSVSPFNAGLGYLEMISDPHLAPHDLGVFRGYASEAMSAVREAHRNASLMARWIRLGQSHTGQLAAARPHDVMSLGDIAGDAIRTLHLGGECERMILRIDPASTTLPICGPVEPLRFAIAVLLRGLLATAGKTGRVTLTGAIEGENVAISAIIEPTPMRIGSGDMFQHALERIAMRHAPVVFERAADGSPRLVIAKAVAARIGDHALPRLAS